jgi:hypothetical protein
LSTSNDLPFDIQDAPRSVQKAYIEMIENDVPPRMAEMLALQQPPGVKGGDRAFMEGRYNNQQFDKMPKDHAQNIITLAKRAGINPSGKYYCAGLADGRGVQDPAAWVDGAGDVKKVAEVRNLTVDGAVQHKGRPQPRPKSVRLSEKLTKEMMNVEKKRKPTMKKEELREYVTEKYGRRKKPNE